MLYIWFLGVLVFSLQVLVKISLEVREQLEILRKLMSVTFSIQSSITIKPCRQVRCIINFSSKLTHTFVSCDCHVGVERSLFSLLCTLKRFSFWFQIYTLYINVSLVSNEILVVTPTQVLNISFVFFVFIFMKLTLWGQTVTSNCWY